MHSEQIISLLIKEQSVLKKKNNNNNNYQSLFLFQEIFINKKTKIVDILNINYFHYHHNILPHIYILQKNLH